MSHRRRSLVALFALILPSAASCLATEDDLASESAAIVVGDGRIARGSTWSYWDRGGDLGTAWRARTFDDSAWAQGRGPLGYGESWLATVVSYGGSSTNKHITTYFRTQFTVADPAAVRRITGELLYDDGIVVYLNGAEIGRQGVPTPTTAATRAAGHEANPSAYETYDWTAQIPHLVAGVNTIAVEVHQADASSSDLAFDLALTLETATAPPPPPPPSAGGIARRSTWAYWDRGALPDESWQYHVAADDTWPRGDGPLGYGESYLQTIVGYGGNAANKHITTYFRHEFTVDDPARVESMMLELMYDDGLIVHLNGRRIVNRGLPQFATATDLAAGHEAGNTYEAVDVTFARTVLEHGTNVLAVEVHQQDRASSDLVFDLGLRITLAQPTTGDDVPPRSTWKYWDGAGLGTSWRGTSFDDAAWRSGAGPLGYGESYHATTIGYGGDPNNKHITAYFRRTFTVANPAAVTAMLGDLMYDDGIVVYLNGTEIDRRHMPSGTIGATTLAPGFETGNTYVRRDWSHARSLLRTGTNVIAAEVHQASRSSSDLTFDLALTLETTCAVAPLGNFTGTTGEAFRGSGGGMEDRADVTWTLAVTNGCVDTYRPSGTAYRLVGAHYCWDAVPASGAIEPTDGELVIDRSVSPPTFRLHGHSAWDGYEGCAEDGDTPTTNGVQSTWAAGQRGTISGDVMSGHVGDYGHEIDWHYTRVGASFPAPSGCYEAARDWWTTYTSITSDLSHGGEGTVTWERVSTTGCVDEFRPRSGTAVFVSGRNDFAWASCRTYEAVPSATTVGPGDGTLIIDRSTNPPTFDIEGSTVWPGTVYCVKPDGSREVAYEQGFANWAEFDGAYQTVPFEGGVTHNDGDKKWDWRFER